jgi:hypothetical protein
MVQLSLYKNVIWLSLSGAESSQAEQKLMSLTDKVRPHDSKKNPLPSSAVHRRADHVILHPLRPPPASPGHVLSLSPESSSVTGQSIWYTGKCTMFAIRWILWLKSVSFFIIRRYLVNYSVIVIEFTVPAEIG